MNFYPLEIFRKVLQRHLYSIAVEYFYCIFSHLFTFQVSWCPRQSALLAWAPPRWCPRSGGRCPPPWPPWPTSTPPSPPSSSLWWPSPLGPSPCFSRKPGEGKCQRTLMTWKSKFQGRVKHSFILSCFSVAFKLPWKKWEAQPSFVYSQFLYSIFVSQHVLNLKKI